MKQIKNDKKEGKKHPKVCAWCKKVLDKSEVESNRGICKECNNKIK